MTPSPLPAPVRIAIGFTAEAFFLVYVFGVGRRVVLAKTEHGLETAGA